MKVFVALAALVAVAVAAPANPAPYAPPAYKPNSYNAPTYEDTPPVYSYTYAVADDYSGANFNQNENRDNYATSGSYSVLLPDGRTQTVTYKVDDAYSGYIADVTYSGEAKYPEYKPTYKPASYAPKPAYSA